MIKQFKHKNIAWLDIQSPTKEDLALISKNYKIHSLVTNELASRTDRSRVDAYENYCHLTLQFPVCELCYSLKPQKDTQEIHFIIGKDFLITVHYEHVQALAEFGQILEGNLAIPRGRDDLHAGHLFFQVLRQLYRSLDLGLDVINTELKKVKKDVFSGKEKEMVIMLSDIHHNLIDFQWALRTHDEALKSFELIARDLFGEGYDYYMKILKNECSKIWDTFVNNRETFEDIRQTNESLLTIKTNEVMKTLTILAFITFPLSIISSLFSMSTTATPLVGLPYDFWIVIVLMAIVAVTMFSIFKHKKWF